MRVTFKASPELLKVREIGESIGNADDSFRRQFSILVLVAVRSREIPVRNNNGFRIPPESLDITERQTRDFAERLFLEGLGDFDADLQRARESAAAQPLIQQHYNIDAKLQNYASEYEKYKQHLEPQIQSETNRLLDDWYRDASVLVSEVAEWFCKAHDFEGQMTVSNSAEGGEITPPGSHSFSIPDVFRQAVSEIAQTSHTATFGATEKAAREVTPDDWRVSARAIADEYFDSDTRNNCRDSLAGYSRRVMDMMQERKIHGPRGRIDNPGTIQREALQGSLWWGQKKK